MHISSIETPIKWLKEGHVKVLCFAWLAKAGQIPSCNLEDENAYHILINFSFAKIVWKWIFHWCCIPVAQFTMVGDIFGFSAKWGHCQKKQTFFV